MTTIASNQLRSNGHVEFYLGNEDGPTDTVDHLVKIPHRVAELFAKVARDAPHASALFEVIAAIKRLIVAVNDLQSARSRYVRLVERILIFILRLMPESLPAILYLREGTLNATRLYILAL